MRIKKSKTRAPKMQPDIFSRPSRKKKCISELDVAAVSATFFFFNSTHQPDLLNVIKMATHRDLSDFLYKIFPRMLKNFEVLKSQLNRVLRESRSRAEL